MDNNELKHYGVLGMRWGRRKTRAAQLKAAKAKYRKADDDAFKKYENTIADIEKSYKRGQTLSKKDQNREAKAERDYVNAKNTAKNLYKQSVKSIKESAKVSKGSKAAKITMGVLGTAAVATIATAAVTRRAAMNETILGLIGNNR